MGKIVMFAGLERCDLLYHTVMALNKAKENYKILVIDDSKTHDLYNLIPRPEDFNIAMLDSAIVVKSKIATDTLDYDYVFIYQGMNKTKSDKHLNLSNNVYFQTDYMPTTVDALKDLQEEAIRNNQMLEDRNAMVIFRDCVTTKIKENVILDMLFPVSREHMVVPYDAKDYESYITLLYNGSQKLKATPEFTAALIQILVDLTDTSEKDVKKLLK